MLYGFLSGITLGEQLHGVDVHIARAFFMATLAAQLSTPGGPTLMGIISGIALTRVPGPSAPFLLPASILAGITYDFFMRGGDYRTNTRKSLWIFLASAVSGLGESAVVMGGLTIIGFFGVALTPVVLFLIWIPELGGNVIMSLIGALIAYQVIRSRLKAPIT